MLTSVLDHAGNLQRIHACVHDDDANDKRTDRRANARASQLADVKSRESRVRRNREINGHEYKQNERERAGQYKE